MPKRYISETGKSLIDIALDTKDFIWVEEILEIHLLKECTVCKKHKPFKNFKSKGKRENESMKRKGYCRSCERRKKNAKEYSY